MANYQWFTKFHRQLYIKTRGFLGHKMGPHKMALLHTIGAKSKVLRLVPLRYYQLRDDGIIVLASNNGQPKPPAWLFNLRKTPLITVQLGRKKHQCKALELDDETCQRLWPQMVAENPLITDYPKNAGRKLPIVLLEYQN